MLRFDPSLVGSGMIEDEYRSVARLAAAEIKIKGSRFIAEAVPVANEGEAEDHIARVRKREYGATHHCTAYRVGPKAQLFRFNDDGEPAGTAGQPILRQIEGRDLTDTLVVVTRYFGGTKLGTGGLIRAYAEASSNALNMAGEKKHVISEHLYVSFSYDDTSSAMHVIQKFDAEVIESDYTEMRKLTVAVPRSRTDEFEKAFTNALGGRGVLRRSTDHR